MQLAKLLEAIANPTRLALLRQLRRSPTVGEIRVRAEQSRDGLPEDRPMARQGVRQHLERLVEAGFAQGRPGWRGEQEVEEYVVLHQRLFALAEDLRQLGDLRPYDAAPGPETSDVHEPEPQPLPRGPCLVVVHGLGEGRAFRLGPDEREWLVGRARGIAASLDYDPYVSSRHARLYRDADAIHVEDMPGSRNGTYLNWARLKGPERLRHGDIIGLGKSLLLFRE